MGFQSSTYSPGRRGEEGAGLLWLQAEAKPLSFLLRIDKIGAVRT
jgi:hypothetical protein